VIANTLYDPSVSATLEKVARLVGQYERAVVAVVGHTDSSMKGKGTRYEDVKALSTDRAEAVKQALVKKYNFDPNKFTVEGKAWDEPANADDPTNQALNRRVEVSVYPPEQK
jgi:flagellar motor protein MotB